MLPALLAGASEARAAIVDLGNTLDRELRETLVALPPVGAGETLNFGVAHGRAGVLFALMRWREICRRGGPDPALDFFLRGLAAHAEEAGEGLRWRWMSPLNAAEYMAGCATVAPVSCICGLWPKERLGIKTMASWRGARLRTRTWSLPRSGDLCRGAAGRSYAMLNLYRHTGECIWLKQRP